MDALSRWLSTPVRTLRGVGPKREAAAAQLGLSTFGELLHHFPRAYRDLRWDGDLATLVEGEYKTVWGTVRSLSWRGRGRGQWTARLELPGNRELPGDGEPRPRLKLCWFASRWRRPPVEPGWCGHVSGRLQDHEGLQMVHPAVEAAPAPDTPSREHGRIVGVYRAGAGLRPARIRRWIDRVLESCPPDLKVVLETGPALALFESSPGRPAPLDLLAAYRGIHFPADRDELRQCREILGRLELVLFAGRQLALRRERAERTAPMIPVGEAVDRRIRDRIGFSLTPGQEKCVGEILGDLARPVPMARMLQGDVGCGKTVVALYAALATVAAGHQVAVLGPTGPLVRQHFADFAKRLAGSRVRLAALTAGSPDREGIQADLAAGRLDLVIGTHVLLSEDTRFHDLGLVIIDEEQRFGVRQRQLLAREGPHAPHFLAMSATPIPRSLAMTVLGDVDLSVIDGHPPGRGEVTTHAVPAERREAALEHMAAEVRRGNRVVFVVPRVAAEDRMVGRDPDVGDDPGHADEAGEAHEDHENHEDHEDHEDEGVASVERQLAALAASPLGEWSPIGLHGRLPTDAQEAVLDAFRSGKRPVLVATTVVEVGLDIPEITVIWIEDADRFGLSQLHQLRGRVGRSGRRSWCFVHSRSQNRQAQNRQTQNGQDQNGQDQNGQDQNGQDLARDRLETFCRVQDGFALAEEDLRARGAGERFGTEQSGLPWFRLDHPLADLEAFGAIRRAVHDLWGVDPDPVAVRPIAPFGPYFAGRVDP